LIFEVFILDYLIFYRLYKIKKFYIKFQILYKKMKFYVII